ncbi:MAG: hypothetical protein M1837_004441 [Sclerophora amabilis]|nr:MAG: hypothetical protein M1837_004441 [Sclerophora amabilis]
MAGRRVGQLAAIYDERSGSYDESFHPRLAADFIDWANLKPGENVLDLACGTGVIALHAKEKVGERGAVVGVDVSDGMLDEARRKAGQDGLDVTFMNRDMSSVTQRDLAATV